MVKQLFRCIDTGGLLKDSSILFVGMAIVHACNLLFTVIMGRYLSDTEFALLVALLSMFNILAIPLGVIASAVNRYSRLLIMEGRRGDVRRLVSRSFTLCMIVGCGVALICFVFPKHIASFLHLERTAPVYILGIVVLGAFIRPIFDGAMSGLQCFMGWSVSSIAGWGSRLIIGWILVSLVSAYAGWGLLGHGLGFYIAIFCGARFVVKALSGESMTTLPLPKMHDYLFYSFFVLVGLSVLQMGDVIMVKHLFRAASGDFSYAATMGRLVVFIPQAFVAAMFPKVVSEKGGNSSQMMLFKTTLLITTMVTVSAASLFCILAERMLWIVFEIKEPSHDMLTWCCTLTWIMVPVSLLVVTVRYALAQRKFRTVRHLPIVAVCYIGITFVWGRSVSQLLLVLAVCVSVALTSSLYGVFSRPSETTA